jgi:cysteine desulfurase
MKRIYLDYAATTPVSKKVLNKMIPYFSTKFGNESSVHKEGHDIKNIVENAREKILNKLNAKNHKIIFTSGGTESNNLAIKGILEKYKEKGKHIITTKIEHDCVLNTCKYLESKGYRVTYLDVDREGFINLEQLKKEIKKDTLLVSIIHANNEIGTLQNIEQISKICKEKNVFFHTDACQSFTKEKIDLGKTNIDLLTINAHKIYGPKGVGGLVIKNGINLEPLFHGGGHEYRLRSGTLNIPGIVGFSYAIDEIKEKDILKIKSLRDYLIKKILTEIPTARLNGPLENRLINNINFSFKYIEGESILLHLDFKGFSVSTGSACSSNTLKTNHVIKAIKVPDNQANGVIRISLGKETKKQEIDLFIKELKIIVENLTKMSPVR